MAMAKRRFLAWAASGVLTAPALLFSGAARAQSCTSTSWPQWEQFVRRHVQADGRVVDFSLENQQSTSEGQSYAMLFALVANDRERFARLWRWSRDNLGAAGASLPAWQWGRRANGSYGVLDPNSASDADLWIAYALLEAARLWHLPDYQQAAMALLAQVKNKEVVDLPKLGPMLLPGPFGFVTADKWRLNLSYLPLPLLRKLQRVDAAGPWTGMIAATQQLLRQAAPQGYAPDWLSYDGTAVGIDEQSRGSGSYDAIRVYLWAGMTDDADPLAAVWRNSVAGMQNYLNAHGVPPELVDTASGVVAAGQAQGPWGFSAALLPYLKASGQDALLKGQLRLVQQQWSKASEPDYYNNVLALFGWGWLQGQFRFAANGDLLPAWQACAK
jgi:endo-1,4-beta-D-glucanase Y